MYIDFNKHLSFILDNSEPTYLPLECYRIGMRVRTIEEPGVEQVSGIITGLQQLEDGVDKVSLRTEDGTLVIRPVTKIKPVLRSVEDMTEEEMFNLFVIERGFWS